MEKKFQNIIVHSWGCAGTKFLASSIDRSGLNYNLSNQINPHMFYQDYLEKEEEITKKDNIKKENICHVVLFCDPRISFLSCMLRGNSWFNKHMENLGSDIRLDQYELLNCDTFFSTTKNIEYSLPFEKFWESWAHIDLLNKSNIFYVNYESLAKNNVVINIYESLGVKLNNFVQRKTTKVWTEMVSEKNPIVENLDKHFFNLMTSQRRFINFCASRKPEKIFI